ncbi:MAG: hypothetical protein V7746_18325 [Halioglobus sp.]
MDNNIVLNQEAEMHLVRFLCSVLVGLCVGHQAYAGDIVHDGEFNFVKAQHEKAWDLQDKRVDARLAEIQKQQGGKRPNILYILVDDVGFGDFGIPELNYVRGTQTPPH